jgi:hypothetical protein
VKTALEAVIGLAVKVLPRAPLPAERVVRAAPALPRGQAARFSRRAPAADGTRILGLTGIDISTTKGTVSRLGRAGLGRIDGASSVISRFRCAMKSRGAAHARERLAKVAVHEADTRWASSTARTGLPDGGRRGTGRDVRSRVRLLRALPQAARGRGPPPARLAGHPVAPSGRMKEAEKQGGTEERRSGGRKDPLCSSVPLFLPVFCLFL